MSDSVPRLTVLGELADEYVVDEELAAGQLVMRSRHQRAGESPPSRRGARQPEGV
jgi:hypothetical protein